MPRSIAFAWTSAALLHGRKTVTRRDWNDDYARGFHAGDIVIATNRQPRHGGTPIARIRLTQAPHKEHSRHAPDSDYEGEGFRFMEENPRFVPKHDLPWSWAAYQRWRQQAGEMWVVRFEVIELLVDPPPLVKPSAATLREESLAVGRQTQASADAAAEAFGQLALWGEGLTRIRPCRPE